MGKIVYLNFTEKENYSDLENFLKKRKALVDHNNRKLLDYEI